MQEIVFSVSLGHLGAFRDDLSLRSIVVKLELVKEVGMLMSMLDQSEGPSALAGFLQQWLKADV